jgi:hypothetical protein
MTMLLGFSMPVRGSESFLILGVEVAIASELIASSAASEASPVAAVQVATSKPSGIVLVVASPLHVGSVLVLSD